MRLPRPRIFFTNIICVCVCLFVHECAHMYICIPNECMYVCMCTFINVHVYMCIYLHMCVCMQTKTMVLYLKGFYWSLINIRIKYNCSMMKCKLKKYEFLILSILLCEISHENFINGRFLWTGSFLPC